MRKYYKILKLTSLYSVLFILSFLTPENVDKKNISLDIEKAHADAYLGGGGGGGGTDGCTDGSCGACGVGCTDGAACTDGGPGASSCTG